MIERQPIKVFISYSWDDDDHRRWVRDFAARLRSEGIDAILDRWQAIPGDQLPEFMEQAVRESAYVLCVCTPRYKEKSDLRDGGVGYEGDIMTSEVFVARNQRKFIPILRTDEWKAAAPSWLSGKYYIDLRGDPYSEENYKDLFTTLCGVREVAPPIGSQTRMPATAQDDCEFVNREIELATLDPVKLQDSYWQCALVSAPTGYGKSRLLQRLLNKIHQDPELDKRWNCRYIDLRNCANPENATVYIAKEITGEVITSDANGESLKNRVCSYVLDEMSMPAANGTLRGILLIVDSIEELGSTAIEWFYAVLHDIVVDSYIDYEQGDISFPVRVILSGIETDSFWQSYLKWEASSQKDWLKPPKKLPLSAFDDLAIQDLISRRSKSAGFLLKPANIPAIAYELQYLSGGHPQVVSEILNELVAKKFLRYKDYFRENREELVKRYVSRVVKRILYRFPLPEAQKDIKTICVFRLIDLNTLRELLSEGLVSSHVDISLLGLLCENKILNPPKAEKLFYHDDIIRRILYLDLALGHGKDKEHVQQVHKCAKSLYHAWIEVSRDQHSFHHFFVEWLFHTLQITGLTDEEIFSEWKSLMLLMDATPLPATDLKRAIREMVEADSEVKYLYRERFNSEDFSPLFS